MRPSFIQVEFYGIPRQRAGVASIQLEAPCETASLGEVLSHLAERLPRFAEECVHGGSLRGGYCVNLNGERFVSDPSAPVAPGDCLLIMSADAGG